MKDKLKSGTRVMVHSLGERYPNAFGTITGISYDDNYFRSYIVFLDDPSLFPDQEYQSISIPESCLTVLSVEGSGTVSRPI